MNGILGSTGGIQKKYVLNNLNSLFNPTANDDASKGYDVTSIFYNKVTGRVFMCMSTQVGSAIWADLTSAAVSGSFKGFWNASTNDPYIYNGTGNNGDYYFTSSSGTVDLGSGPISFGNGDMVINDDGVWSKIPAQNLVTSVFGRIGAITAQSGDYDAEKITLTPIGNISAVNVQAGIVQIDALIEEIISEILNHVNDTNNPHQVTKAQVGLSEVDNTSDLDKPISNATQIALNEKISVTDTTDDLDEGSSNLYYTEERVRDVLYAELETYDALGNLPDAELEFFSDSNLNIIRGRYKDYQPSGSINYFIDRRFGNDNYSGKSELRKKQWIQSAVNVAENGASFDIAPYQYNENITLTAASSGLKDNFLFEGKAVTGSFPTVIQGDLTISGSVTRQRFKNIQFGTAGIGGKITFDGDEGRHYFNNIHFDNGIEAKNGFKRFHDFNNCSGKGIISLGETGTPASGCNFFFNNCDFTDVTDLRIGHANVTVILFNNRRLPQKITHTAGNLIIIPPATFETSSSIFLESTCEAGQGKIVLWSGYNFMKSDNSTYGRINKTGTCDIHLGLGIRDFENDIINGNIIYIQKTNDLDTGLAPENFSSLNSLLNNILTGIDEKFGQTDSYIATKQDELVSGENIKTIDGREILGGGNLSTKFEYDFVDKTQVVVNHNFGYRPQVMVLDQDGNTVDILITHVDSNSFAIYSDILTSGKIIYC